MYSFSRIVCEIVASRNISSTYGTSSTASYLNSTAGNSTGKLTRVGSAGVGAGFSANRRKSVRVPLSPNRLLSTALQEMVELLEQFLYGMKAGQVQHTAQQTSNSSQSKVIFTLLPNELTNAFSELEQFIASLNENYNMQLDVEILSLFNTGNKNFNNSNHDALAFQSLSLNISSNNYSMNGNNNAQMHAVSDRMSEILHDAIFLQENLPSLWYSRALSHGYSLFETIETAMRTAMTTLQDSASNTNFNNGNSITTNGNNNTGSISNSTSNKPNNSSSSGKSGRGLQRTLSSLATAGNNIFGFVSNNGNSNTTSAESKETAKSFQPFAAFSNAASNSNNALVYEVKRTLSHSCMHSNAHLDVSWISHSLRVHTLNQCMHWRHSQER